MKLNQNILPTISGAVDLNVTGFWISSFNLSKHPGERGYMAWIDWQSSITRAYQTPVCNYEGSVWQQDLICAGIIVAEICAERSSAPYCDPSTAIICVSPASTKAPNTASPTFSQCSHKVRGRFFPQSLEFVLYIQHLLHKLTSLCNLCVFLLEMFAKVTSQTPICHFFRKILETSKMSRKAQFL